MTFVFKDDKTIGAYIYGKKPFRHKENEPVRRAGSEETICLLDIAGQGSEKVSVQVSVKGKKDEYPAS